MVHFEEDNPDDLLGNMVVLGVSLIVIAAVVIGVVAGIDHDDAPLKPEKMTLDAICDLTDYKESCMASLQPVGNYAQVITYFRAAVNATISEMALAMKKAKVDADAVRDDHGSTETTMAFEDCIELIGLCIEELQSVLTMVNATPNLFFKDSGDARSSLSAVLSYQRACLEGLKESRSTSDMDRGLQKPSELASNALAIIYEHSENNDLEADHSIPNWGTGTTDNDGMIYPDRLSAADRKLLHNSYKKGGQMMTPHAVVAKDGSGQYASIAAALNAYPIAHKGRYLIYVRSGVYEENVIISKNITQIFMYGDGVNRTVISGRDFNGTTYRRASLCEFSQLPFVPFSI
jgi:pectinesterase